MPGTGIAECGKRSVWTDKGLLVELSQGKPRKTVQPACFVFAVSEEKKEGWSWESYLEEQKAVTAPVSLFQDVSWTISV